MYNYQIEIDTNLKSFVYGAGETFIYQHPEKMTRKEVAERLKKVWEENGKNLAYPIYDCLKLAGFVKLEVTALLLFSDIYNDPNKDKPEEVLSRDLEFMMR